MYFGYVLSARMIHSRQFGFAAEEILLKYCKISILAEKQGINFFLLAGSHVCEKQDPSLANRRHL